MDYGIELKNVTKAYKKKLALDHLSVAFPTEQITGLLGPNGAGKSTLLKMLVGLVHQDEGSISLFS